MLSVEEFARKLVGFTADGAPVMGTQRQSRPLAAPVRGPVGNLAHALLERKKEYCNEGLLVAWCCPHRLDLTAAALEDLPDVGPILQMVRRMAAHVANHPSARASLGALHKLFTGEWHGGLDALHFAPHRFLSHAVPTAVVCDSMQELLAYVYGILSRPADERLRLWALRMREDLQPLKFHLLLAACADLLGILRKANLRTQRSALHILEVDDVVAACVAELDAYIQTGGVLNKALLTLGAPCTQPGKGWRIERVCRQIQLVKKGGQLIAKYCIAPGQPHELTMHGPNPIKDVEKSVHNVAEVLQADLQARFANTGILKFAHVLRPEWDDQEPAGGGHEIRHVLAAWAGHFDVDAALLLHQWPGLHAARKQFLGTEPAAKTAPIHTFWPPLLVRHAAAAPEVCRCIAAFITVSWQNAQVERDLAIVKKVKERGQGQLGQTRLDARVRVEISGPPPDKERGQRVKGVLRTIVKEWMYRKRRQRAPAHRGLRGPQGPLPQRAAVRAPGPLVQALPQPHVSTSMGHAGNGVGAEAEEVVNAAEMLE